MLDCWSLGDKVLNRPVAKVMLCKAWASCQYFHITDIGVNRFMFTVHFESEAKRIIDEGLWNVFGKLLLVRMWDPALSVSKLDTSKIMPWVQLYDVPLEFISNINAHQIGENLGAVIQVDSVVIDVFFM